MPVPPIHPKVQFMRKHLTDTIHLSFEKAAAHLNHPGQYPLPAGKDSLEYAIVDLYKVLPKKKREQFLDKMKENLSASAASRQQKYGALAAVDLHSSKAVLSQVETIPVPDQMKFTETDIKNFRENLPNKKPVPAVKGKAKMIQPRQAVTGSALQFAVETITCKETNDVRKDEISISAFVLSSSGEFQESNNFFSGEFKKDDSQSLGPAGNLFSFDIADSTGTVFPAGFVASVFITEKDKFSNKEVTEKVGAILRLTGRIITYGALVTLFIPAIGLPLSLSIVGIGGAMTLIGDWLLFFAADDVSEIETDELLLDTAPFAGETFARELNMRFLDAGLKLDGDYKVAVRWTVV